MKCLSTLLSILLLWLGICGFAANSLAQSETPEDIVKLLYRDFGWELTTDNSSKAILIDQPTNVLTRYFTPKLAGLIVKDRKYQPRP